MTSVVWLYQHEKSGELKYSAHLHIFVDVDIQRNLHLQGSVRFQRLARLNLKILLHDSSTAMRGNRSYG